MGRFRMQATEDVIKELTGKIPSQMTDEEAEEFNNKYLFDTEGYMKFELLIRDREEMLDLQGPSRGGIR